MNCINYRDALSEAALTESARDAGADAAAVRDAGVRAHLDTCAACRAELERLRALASAIDAGLAQIVSADPSPAFAARVRSRIAEQDEQRASRWRTWAPALAGAMAIVVVVAVLAARFTRETPRPTETVRVQPAPSVTSADAAAPKLDSPIQRETNQIARNTPPRPRPQRSPAAGQQPSLPEVIVTGEEWQQVAKLYALAQKGQADAEALAPPDLTPLEQKFQPLVIARIEPIKPLESKLDVPPPQPMRQ